MKIMIGSSRPENESLKLSNSQQGIINAQHERLSCRCLTGNFGYFLNKISAKNVKNIKNGGLDSTKGCG
jgi:hypothetical protein